VAATQDPKAFATLSETPMTFIYTARDHERTYKHPLIKLGAAGQVEELHYSPPWEVCQPRAWAAEWLEAEQRLVSVLSVPWHDSPAHF
jgi:hypothetical protein